MRRDDLLGWRLRMPEHAQRAVVRHLIALGAGWAAINIGFAAGAWWASRPRADDHDTDDGTYTGFPVSLRVLEVRCNLGDESRGFLLVCRGLAGGGVSIAAVDNDGAHELDGVGRLDYQLAVNAPDDADIYFIDPE